VVGKQITIKINDKVVVDYTEPDTIQNRRLHGRFLSSFTRCLTGPRPGSTVCKISWEGASTVNCWHQHIHLEYVELFAQIFIPCLKTIPSFSFNYLVQDIIGHARVDYSGSQAARMTREEGIKVVLSACGATPLHYMTDPMMADKVHIPVAINC
jgi:hypothetical protein